MPAFTKQTKNRRVKILRFFVFGKLRASGLTEQFPGLV